ncbi:MAG: tRNA (adenosine(37)-N6)-dimethylallyltransferase MiaA [Candidatus Yonathbacteria bacterium]|nr:tRNA (adenosine(37)-N6)-dimethylallyltransferase MiaA [Candidatus Yonathbacteria bacterium]
MSPRPAKQKLIVIVGQTASGKSALAVTIARHVGGEVISADSRQVYRDLPIGSGIITKEDMFGVPHHMLAIANPRNAYTAATYQTDAREIVSDIATRGHIPVVAGGTGFYIDALIYDDILPEVTPDLALRKKLEKKTTQELANHLLSIDPERAASIDIRNSRRLIRAIEIATVLGSVPRIPSRRTSPYDIFWIGIRICDDVLIENIEKRNAAMFRKGLLAEIRTLRDKRIPWARIDELGFEYRYGAAHLRGEMTKEEALARMNIATRQYAKRQKTWFQRNGDIRWFSPGDAEHILKNIDAFLADRPMM